MAVKPYPTLDGRGYINEVGAVADAIFADYFRSQNNQSDLLPIRSLSFDLAQDPDPQVQASNVQRSLQSLLELYIPRSKVSCNVTEDPIKHEVTLTIEMSVTDGTTIRDIGHLMKINGTKVTELSALSANGELVRYPIEHRDYINIWEQ